MAKTPSHESHTPREGATDQFATQNAQFERAEPEVLDTSGADIELEHVTFDSGFDQSHPVEIVAFISPRILLHDAQAWANRNVVSQPAGYHIAVARIYGIARDHSVHKKAWQDGSESESLCLHGVFEAENFVGEKRLRAPRLFIARMYAEQVVHALIGADADATAPMDLVLGCRATGSTPAYTWTVTSLISDAMSAQLDKMRSRAHPMLGQLRAETQRRLQITSPAPNGSVAS